MTERWKTCLLSHIKNKQCIMGIRSQTFDSRRKQTKANGVGLSVMCPSIFTALKKRIETSLFTTVECTNVKHTKLKKLAEMYLM